MNVRLKGREFQTTSAFSAEEAIRVMSSPDAHLFEVALVDVVMETPPTRGSTCAALTGLSKINSQVALRQPVGTRFA